MVCTREAGCNAPPLAPNSRNMPSPVDWNLTIGKQNGTSSSTPANSDFWKGFLSLSLLSSFSASRWMQWHSHEPGGVMG